MTGCVVLAIAGAPACGVLSPEEQILSRFFEASRLHDTTIVSSLSAVTFNPRTEGVVREFEVVDVQRGGESHVVTVDATVAAPDGQVVRRILRVTLQRRDGRWLIVAINGE